MDRNKTLEQLEADVWPQTSDQSFITRESHRLRRIPIRDLTVENLRILIGQKVGLLHLVPLALDMLELNPVCEGGMYRGDLLISVARIDGVFWRNHPQLKSRLYEIRSDLQILQETIMDELLPALQNLENF